METTNPQLKNFIQDMNERNRRLSEMRGHEAELLILEISGRF